VRRASIVTAALLAAAIGGCAKPEAPVGRLLVATVAPEVMTLPLPEPGRRYPPGSRLVQLDLERPAQPPIVLTEDLSAAGGASVSFDGRSLAFVGRRGDDGGFAVFISNADGGERRRLTAAPEGAGAAAWLPDGRLAVAAPTDGRPPLDGMESAWALFVVDPEDDSARRITFGESELDPAVLADGRIVYSQWQPEGDGRPEGGGFGLFTVHPDGTGAAPLHGFHDGSRLKLLARQVADGDLVFVGGGKGETATVRGVDWSRPLDAGYDVALPGSQALSVEPVAADELLVAALDSEGASVLWLLGREGGELLSALAAPATGSFVHAVEVAPRERPQGHLSMVDHEQTAGLLLCVDARSPGMGEAQRVAISARGAGGEEDVLGEVELEADGSFFARVPADRPLFLDLLAADGRVLGKTDTPIWVRPKEVRGCVGCHDNPLNAPPNRRPLAVMDEPVDLVSERES
jgi:hypothetical protein